MIEGAFGVLLTPFNKDGKVNYYAYERELNFVARSNITGFFVCGTTGEFISLSPEENVEMLEFASIKLNNQKMLLAGASSPNIKTTVMYMQKAAEFGYDAAVICPPYYFTMGPEDVCRYYEYLADLDIIDIVLYNIPMFTNPIARDVYERLLSKKRIIAMKDSSANMKQIAHEVDLARLIRPDFNILGGTDDCIVPALMAGCVGSVTAFSVILPEVNAKIYELFNKGEIKKAWEVNRSYLKLLRLADSKMFPSGYKLIFEERGFFAGSCQFVDEKGLDDMREEVRKELKIVLDKVRCY